MKRVTGIGGIFFKAKDPKALGAWCKTHLGIDVQTWGGAAFDWKGPDNPQGGGTTAWTLFPPTPHISLQALRPSWSTTASTTCTRCSTRFDRKACASMRRSMNPSTESSAG